MAVPRQKRQHPNNPNPAPNQHRPEAPAAPSTPGTSRNERIRKQPMAVLGQKREHATSRNQLPNHHLGVQQLPLGTRRTLHSKIIPANQAPSRQTRRPPTDLFSGVLAVASRTRSCSDRY